MSQLSWDVFVAPELVLAGDDLPPGLSTRTWGPVSATLIMGREDAVLVDALLTTAQATALAGWIQASGRNLTTVYVTHGHGDHFFGLPIILDRYRLPVAAHRHRRPQAAWRGRQPQAHRAHPALPRRLRPAPGRRTQRPRTV